MAPRPLPKELPPPDPDALAHSERLQRVIQAEIAASGGAITFTRFMELALYAPGLGYYSAGSRKFGEAGDFVTAPEISPLFSRCLARQCAQVLQQVNDGDVLEFGAGTGVMAAHVLNELQAQGRPPRQYYIMELSGELRQRQRDTIAKEAPQSADRVQWLDRLPERFSGVILANELLDAMPVHRVHVDDNHDEEIYVGWDNGFVSRAGPPSDAKLAARLADIRAELGDQRQGDYQTEINLAAEAWMDSVAAILQQGAVLVIDYGFPRHEFYHPQRDHGTLMCHYRHRAHADPLILVGLQDITAHVDFTAVAEAAVDAGLTMAGFTTQAYFLLASGLETFLAEIDPSDTVSYFAATQQVKKLTLPSEMGELFKVMALTKDLDMPLMGFQLHDQRRRL